jgi:dihydrofolate reductase
MGHPVVMGKNTWLSIGKPLDGRINIILTHDLSFNIPGCLTANSIDEILTDYRDEKIFVIGGSEVFRQFIPLSQKMYLTRIIHSFEGDTYFPELNWSFWEMTFYEFNNSESGYQFSFEIWERKAF